MERKSFYNTIAIDKDLHKQLKKYCANKEITIRDYIENMIKIDIKNNSGE
jgi:hypothetical protein